MDFLGAYWYAGTPGSGKTTAALRDAVALSEKTGWPIVFLDTVRVEQAGAFERAETILAFCRLVWGRGRHAAFWPKEERLADAFLGACWGGRRVHAIVDEVHHWASPYRILPNLSLLLRSYRHAEVTLHLTTQSFGDIPQGALAQAPRLRIYRNTAPRTLDRLADYCGLDPEKIRTLPQFEALEWSDGFSS